MKRFLVTIFILILIGASAPTLTHAQGAIGSGQNVPAATKSLTTQTPATKAASDTAAQSDTNTTNSRLGGAVAGILSLVLKPVTGAVRAFLAIILSLLNLILTMAGLLFELVIRFTVTDMKSWVEQVTIIPVIHKSIRDFANMFFIFFLLFESIKLIIGYSDTKKIRTMLIHLVVASLIMNFSLFITKAFIDVSNIAAVGFFQQLPTTKVSDSLATGANANPGLGGAIMQVLKITSIYSTYDIGVDMKFIAGSFGGIVLMIILIFFFFVASAIFLKRFVGLVLLMLFSPLMIAGWILPDLEKYSKEWWSKLLEYCMLAPTFMMLVWIAFKIIQDPGFAKIISSSSGQPSSLFNAFVNPTIDSVLILFNFALIIFLLVSAITNAASMGDHGKAAVDVGKKAMGAIGARTAGRFGNYLDSKIGDTKLGNSEFGRAFRSGTTGLMASSKYYGAKSYSDIEKADKSLKKEIALKDRSMSLKADLDAAIKSGRTDAISDAFKKLTNKEVADLGPKTLMKPEVFAALNDDHFDEMLKNDKFSDADKVAVRNERNKDLLTAISAGDKAGITNALKRMNSKQIEKLDTSILRNNTFALALNSGQFQDILKSGTLTQELKDTLKENRIQNITAATSQPAGTARETAVQQAVTELKMNPVEVSKLKKELLTDRDFIKTLNKDHLSTLIKENVSSDTRSEIKRSIETMLREHNTYAADVLQNQRLAASGQPTTPPRYAPLDPAVLAKLQTLNNWMTNTPAGQDF